MTSLVAPLEHRDSRRSTRYHSSSMHGVLSMIAALMLLMQSAIANDSGYTIGAGDIVEIVVQQRNFGVANFKVSESGEISFPYVGRVKLAGLSTFEAEEKMQEVLRDGYLRAPEVTVSVQTHSGQRVDVLGSVKNPGTYSLTGTTTLRSVIMQAGGAMEGSTIQVRRSDGTIEVGSSALDGAPGEMLVQADDVISVMAGEKVYLSGEVANEGAIAFRRGMTASQAFLENGGPGEYPRLRRAYIIREREKMRINLVRILKGKDSDVDLRPGDRLIVPINPL